MEKPEKGKGKQDKWEKAKKQKGNKGKGENVYGKIG